MKHLTIISGLTVTSFMFTQILLGLAVHFRDGAATLAISRLATTSSAVSLAANGRRRYWSILIRGDLIIYGMQDAFVVVNCDEFTARVLYLHLAQH